MLHPEGVTERLTARVLFAEILEKLDTTLITIADDAAAPTQTLELMKSVQADENTRTPTRTAWSSTAARRSTAA